MERLVVFNESGAVLFFLFTMPVTHPYSLWNLRKNFFG